MFSQENIAMIATIACCLYASYTDIKERKILNVCTYGLLLFGMVSQILFILEEKTTISQVATTALSSCLMAFLVYYSGIWSPGDSKLFWGVSVTLPPSIFKYATMGSLLPPVIIIINIFTLYFFYVVFYLLFFTSWEHKKKAFRQSIDFKVWDFLGFLFNLPCFLGLGYVVIYIIAKLGLKIDTFMQILIFISLFSIFNKLINRYNLKKYKMLIFSPFLIITVFVVSPPLMSILRMFIVFIVLYLFFRTFILNLGDISFVNELSILELQEGMVPAERIVKSEGGYERKSAVFAGLDDKNITVNVTPKGLSAQKIEELKRLAEEGYFLSFDNKLKIQQSMIFAPVISFGVILTIVCKGPLYRFLV